MIYTFLDLRMAGLIVGVALIAIHAIALIHADQLGGWLKAFPRSKAAGATVLTIVGLWSFALIATMDLGEFTSYRTALLILIPIAYYLTLQFVDEFLAVRAAGMLMLLLAEPILEAAFLRPEASRLLLVLLAYIWVVLGMFWVGMPYVMRTQISWLLKTRQRLL